LFSGGRGGNRTPDTGIFKARIVPKIPIKTNTLVALLTERCSRK